MKQDEVEIDVSKSILLNPAEANLPFYSGNPELVSLSLMNGMDTRQI